MGELFLAELLYMQQLYHTFRRLCQLRREGKPLAKHPKIIISLRTIPKNNSKGIVGFCLCSLDAEHASTSLVLKRGWSAGWSVTSMREVGTERNRVLELQYGTSPWRVALHG